MVKLESQQVTIYTDGACDPNPGHGGWAAVIFMPEGIKEISGHENPSTNNRMELMAAIQSLQSFKERIGSEPLHRFRISYTWELKNG